jgi:hypothetical protein
MRIAAVVALLLAPSLALAQPSYQPPVAPARPIEVAPIKSEQTATALAIGGTLGGFALTAGALRGNSPAIAWAALAGTLVGPSLGHIYSGESLHAVGTTVLRAAGGTAMILGAISLTTASSCDPDLSDCSGGYTGQSRDEAMIWIGAAVYLGATIYDIIDARYAARRANERHARSIMLAPSLVSTTGGGSAPAVSLTGRF